jgi:hypothetical protein
MPAMLARAVALLTLSAVPGLAACSEPPEAPVEPRPVVSSPNSFSVAEALTDGKVEPQLVNVNYLDGQVTGDGGRVPVRLGSLVRLTVVADVAETVVVEGFDQTFLTAVDQPVQIVLLAQRAGEFDVTLRESGETLTTLVVG